LVEVAAQGITVSPRQFWVMAFCVICGGVVPYALWNNALRHWRTSQVMLFNNLIPLSTMTWAHFSLHEPVTPTFWAAMILIVAGVALGYADWTKILGMTEGF
jgi:drug/metabolite transporter (DMT)-like permease